MGEVWTQAYKNIGDRILILSVLSFLDFPGPSTFNPNVLDFAVSNFDLVP